VADPDSDDEPTDSHDRWRSIASWFGSPAGRWTAGIAAVLVGGALAATLVLGFAFALVYSNLPPIDTLVDYRPKIPLRVWTVDGVLIGEFGEERRTYITIQDVPERLKQAILAAEDDSFYRHRGVDIAGLARAALANFASGRRGQGGSTITMQVARNFYLSSERSYLRKLYEIALSYKIEATLSKDRILEVYINQIFLGQRAYGFGAAAQIYFGKPLKDLSVAETALLAGLPAAPSAYNPLVNPKRAKARQTYVLGRMLALNFIDKPTYDSALAEEIQTRSPTAVAATPLHPRVHAEFAAETVRQLMFDVFREETYTRGLNVYTTLASDQQQVAYNAVRAQVLDYDRRYGYRGPEAFIEMDPPAGRDQRIDDALAEAIDSEGLLAAVVLDASPKEVRAQLAGGEVATVTGDGLKFVAQAGLGARAQPGQKIVPGAVIRLIHPPKGGWAIAQLPAVEAAYVSADSRDGAVLSLVGGFDFNLNKFNHVTQAWRQPGSSIKPFIYAAALEKGFTPSTLVNDAPLVVDPDQTGGQVWEPKNFEGKYDGPLRLRQGLARSKNMVSIRVLQAITPQYAQRYITRFGFDPERHPPFLTMALGAGSVTPWQQLAAYSVFATGGYLLSPYLVGRVTDASGRTLMEAQPKVAGSTAPRVLDARVAFIMDSMLRDVTRYGTAAKAASLKRNDLAGKTGTTNDSHDAWFAGYGGGLVGIAWMGFDQPRNLGEKETGGGLALPIWMTCMQAALKGAPDVLRDPPPGVVSIGGEYYLEEYPPGLGVASLGLDDALPADQQKKQDEVKDQIF
jgi:penicillin-binding protein 1A